MAHEQQTRYAKLVDAKLRAGLVTVDSGSVPVVNTRYEGTPKAGAVKVPVRDGEVHVGDYNKATGKKPTNGNTTYITVTDFYDKAVNEVIDGYDAAAVPDNIVADRLDSAGYAGAQTLDADTIATMEAEGTILPSATALTADTVYQQVVKVRTAMSKANVPAKGRYLLVPPETYELMLLDEKHFIKQSDLSQTLVQEGYIGMMAGFAIKETNNADPNTEFIAGHADWVTRIREWVVAPFIQDLNGDADYVGASAVKGRWVYKHKVTKPQTVLVKTKT